MNTIETPNIDEDVKKLPPERAITVKWLAFLLGLAITAIIYLSNRSDGVTTKQLDDKDKELAEKQKALDDCYTNNTYWQEKSAVADSEARVNKKELLDYILQDNKRKDETIDQQKKLLTITKKVK